jgi:hypothetical protein
MAAAEDESNTLDAANATAVGSASEGNGPMAAGAASEANPDEMAASTLANQNDPLLEATVNKFFSAINKRNWSSALALINEDEKKLLLDDKGQLKESSKQRLSQMDQKNREALVMQDGKLTGVTLLLPSN